MTNDRKAFALRCAEESFRTDNEEIAVLKEAAIILCEKHLSLFKIIRRSCRISRYRAKRTCNFPHGLIFVVDGLIFGHRKFNSEESSEQKVLTGTIASSIINNIKTDGPVKLAAKRKTQDRH